MNAEALELSFVDTDVFVYAVASDDSRRAPLAQELIRNLMSARKLHTSTQVLQELYVTLTRKVQQPLPAEHALHYLDQIAAWPVISLDYRAIREATKLSSSASLSYWDALMVVAAARSGARHLYTEDLQDGQTVLGVEIRNPFRSRCEVQ